MTHMSMSKKCSMEAFNGFHAKKIFPRHKLRAWYFSHGGCWLLVVMVRRDMNKTENGKKAV